jgi:hypothetical protein
MKGMKRDVKPSDIGAAGIVVTIGCGRGRATICDAGAYLASSVWGTLGDGTLLRANAFSIGGSLLLIEVAMPPSEYTMNIFYVIGVVVVILFVAGFLGLHA